MTPPIPFWASSSLPWQRAAAALLLAPLASARVAPAVPSGTASANELGVPALFSWGDFDGDGRLDLAAVSGAGSLQLLANAGDGRFDDVTERIGLSAVGNAALALWADYDGDGRLDLFVGAREGASRLFHNEGEAFVDMSAGSGLASEGAVQSAQWLDHDGDGRLDLFVVTAQKNELFRGLEGGFFERAELPLGGVARAPGLGGFLVDTGTEANGEDAGGVTSAPGSPSERDGVRRGGSIGGSLSVAGVNAFGGNIARGPSGAPTLPFVAVPACLDSISDQANPNACLEASTTPTLGRLYPISANLFVAVGGNVGIGTTSPAAKLDVAGTARMTGTLTLAPGVDQALDISTGSIYKGGALFIHTKGGPANTALGQEALANVTSGFLPGVSNTAVGSTALMFNTYGFSNTAIGANALRNNTTGSYNTASGVGALFHNTTGTRNTASGDRALSFNTTGNKNTASGQRALYHNTTGTYNTASGHMSLYYNTTGSRNTASGFAAQHRNTTGLHNTASGYRALVNNTTGARNTALGSNAGSNLTTGNDNIAIGNSGVAGEGATIRIGTAGTHTRAFTAGIRGVTTVNANAIPVLVDSAGQLGTVSSSRRFKKDIADMGDATERLLELRPVVFRYKQEQELPDGGEVPLEYGLIAEEVAEIFPELVVYGEEGQPFTVKYHLLSSMLLNEMKKMQMELTRLRGLEARLAALEARTSPVTSSAAIPADSR